MATKRIIAHYMHEGERAQASNSLKNAQVTDSFAMGEIDESQIPALQKEGLIIQILEDALPAETPAAERQPIRAYRRNPVLSRAVTSMMGTLDADPEPAKDNYIVLQIKGPLLEPWRRELSNSGVKLLENVSNHNYTARVVSSGLQQIRALPFVGNVRPYRGRDTGPLVLKAEETQPTSPKVMTTFDLRLHPDANVGKVVDWLKNNNVDIAGQTARKIRIYLMEDSPLQAQAASLPEVATMEEYVPPKLHNDVARVVLAIDHANPGTNIPLTGKDEIVAVADTGLDDQHPDFQGRIAGIVARGRQGNHTDPHGHGTHVAGSVLGSGAASQGKLKGTAPDAHLFFQSLLDSNGGLGGLPLDLGDLFDEAYKTGARIHNNSWGSATSSMYTINSIEVDEYVANHRDMLVVISAGNEGTAAAPKNAKKGFVDWLSLGSPATSKNALTVGASRSSRKNGAYSSVSYSQAWPGDYPDAPIAGDMVSGDPECLAAFSSRGPCDDRRIKPDLVAPGTDIASAKSSLAPPRSFWGAYPGNTAYAFMGGTSMSAPLASGCAALVREYYAKQRAHPCSAALVKATLINGTRWLKGSDATADHSKTPNYHQGFGCIDMSNAVPNPMSPQLQLEFIDSWKDQGLQFHAVGERFRFRLSVAGGMPLRICMAYTDLPARALQNNLNVFLEDETTKRKFIGNEDVPNSLKIPDPDNNVEIIRVESPTSGSYLIQVSASNLLSSPQDFALVVTGQLTSGLQRV